MTTVSSTADDRHIYSVAAVNNVADGRRIMTFIAWKAIQ